MTKKAKIQAVNIESAENNVLQKIVVDFDKRTAPPVIHLTQHDNSMPVISITAQAQGEAYAIPDGATVNLRLSAADGEGVRVPVADISGDRQTAYVSITGDVTKAAGTAQAVLEIVQGDGVIASAPIVLDIAGNLAVAAVEVITTPAETVSLENNNIAQYVYVYMDERPHAPTVYLTQYDTSIPIIAVNIVYDGQPYKIPDGAAVNVRMEKPDGKHVYNPALGLSDDRYTAYIAITAQMTAAHGMGRAVVELSVDGGIVGTAPIDIRIDANPVPEDAYISSDEYKTIYELLDDVEQAAKEAVEAANSVKDSAQMATEQAKAAQKSAESAKESAEKAENVSAHPPILREGSDHWYIWDAETNDYVDSGVDAGVSVTVAPETITGEPGTSAKVENTGTATDPVLKFTIPRGADGKDGEGKVSSVNGQTGDVVLTPEDIGAQEALKGTPGKVVGYNSNGAAEEVTVGGRNLLLNSGAPIKNSKYFMAAYNLADTPKVGEVYTVQIKGKLGGGKTSFGVFNSGSDVRLCILALASDSIYKATFNWTNSDLGGSVTVAPENIQIYTIPHTTIVESEIEWIKLERGSVATDWAPAPQDMQPAIFDQSLGVQLSSDELRALATALKTYM